MKRNDCSKERNNKEETIIRKERGRERERIERKGPID